MSRENNPFHTEIVDETLVTILHRLESNEEWFHKYTLWFFAFTKGMVISSVSTAPAVREHLVRAHYTVTRLSAEWQRRHDREGA